MFGMGFSEILLVAVIAVLFLGPDKLPEAMVQIAKFFKSFKSSINEAKSSIEQEVKIQELKEDALEYKKQITSVANSAKKQLSLDELEEIKSSTKDISKSIQELKENALSAKKSIQDPMGTNRVIKNDEAGI
ncbi:MAG: Sec-independent protein translocase subunit TatB [Epsilonproteobacteria bacterium]|nr:Sec-independent protein translocase subunit TatB [Campylobacterota bacterium]